MRGSGFSKCFSMIAFALLAVAGTAEAQVCIRFDKTRDTLSDEDRARQAPSRKAVRAGRQTRRARLPGAIHDQPYPPGRRDHGDVVRTRRTTRRNGAGA